MNREIRVKKISPDKKKRQLFISDIHGNLSLLKKGLIKINYDSKNDELYLLGDLVEKGHENLATLHWIMENKITCIMGNCDFIAKNVLYSYRLDFLKDVLLKRKESLIHEMANKLGLKLDFDTDMETYCQTIRNHFLKELNFLDSLPHILECDDFICTHASLISRQNYGSDFREVMTTPFYLNKIKDYGKLIICGHFPVTEYCDRIASFEPIFDASHNVFSIDGGNMVKNAGQLNILAIDKNRRSIDSIDDLKEAVAINDTHPYNPTPFFVNWNQGQVQIRKKANKQYYVYSPHLNRSFWVDKQFIYYQNGHTMASDYTNYQMPLKKGDHVKIVCIYEDKALIKKKGVLGWTSLSNLAL